MGGKISLHRPIRSPIAGMPARAGTAYRGAKASVGGPKMTTQELQLALTKLTTAQAKKLFAFVQQIQAARKAGLKEGVTPDTLLPSYEQALKAFVQKNMLAGMQYSRLQNASQIDGLIKQIVDAQNDSESAQRDLWNKLTLAAGVAQHNAAQAGGEQTGGETPSTTPTTRVR
jgi:predicted anti-sigma-YlaC factor YlaD